MHIVPKDTVAPSDTGLGAYCRPDQSRECYIPAVSDVDWRWEDGAAARPGFTR